MHQGAGADPVLRRAPLPANLHRGALAVELELKAVLGAEPLDVGLDRGVEVPDVRPVPADFPTRAARASGSPSST